MNQDYSNQNDDDDEWKPIHKYHKALTSQCQTIHQILRELKEVYGENIADYSGQQLHFMLDDSFVISAKLAGANHNEDFIVLMENASLIRYHMKQLLTSTFGLEFDLDEKPTIEADYIKILRKEIDNFKEYFRLWVNEFPPKEIEDDWGLY